MRPHHTSHAPRPKSLVLCLALLSSLQPSALRRSAFSLLATFFILHSTFLISAEGASLAQPLQPATRPKSDRRNLYSLLPDNYIPNPLLDYIINTELTPAGRKLPPPNFQTPVYYTIANPAPDTPSNANGVASYSPGLPESARATLGNNNKTPNPNGVASPTSPATTGGTPTPPSALQPFNPSAPFPSTLITALATNGYRLHDPRDPAHPPTQTLTFAWGKLNKVAGLRNTDPAALGIDDLPPLRNHSKDPLPPDSGDIEDIPALIARATTAGGRDFADKFTKALSAQIHLERLTHGQRWAGDLHMDGDLHASPLNVLARTSKVTYALVDAAFNECYYLQVTSTASGTLLWTTRITIIPQGANYEKTMPNVITNVAYFLGRETPAPEYLRKRAYKKAAVEIGTPTILYFNYNPAKR